MLTLLLLVPLTSLIAPLLIPPLKPNQKSNSILEGYKKSLGSEDYVSRQRVLILDVDRIFRQFHWTYKEILKAV